MQRLKTRPQFQAVLAGITLARTAHFALHACPVQSTEVEMMDATPALFPAQALWLGAMVPKRWAKRAVTRNTIKRQIYAVAAQYQAQLVPQAHLVRLRAGFDRAVFVSACSDALKAAIRTELNQLFTAGVARHPR